MGNILNRIFAYSLEGRRTSFAWWFCIHIRYSDYNIWANVSSFFIAPFCFFFLHIFSYYFSCFDCCVQCLFISLNFYCFIKLLKNFCWFLLLYFFFICSCFFAFHRYHFHFNFSLLFTVWLVVCFIE